MDIDKIRNTLMKLGRSKVKFIILFGSMVNKRNTPLSDVDVAVYYDGNKKERFKFRIEASGNLPDKVDLQIFQDLPLYIQKEVIAGRILYYDNYQFIFNEFMRIIKDFDSFEKYYQEYLNGLKEGVAA
ncbi:MAG TPA: nucleotidyltransferase domain-containing protein [Candidatus Nanoarchaeia archaeon]|nr:nucleotidyltransferase domain-containing protein [Candidatus Nanoarchaeia archaeon]